MDLLPKKELHGQNPVVTYATKQVGSMASIPTTTNIF